MHTYRDAIRGAEQHHPVQYAAILYPGPSKHYGQEIEALQALPGSAATLEEQLGKILTDALSL